LSLKTLETLRFENFKFPICAGCVGRLNDQRCGGGCVFDQLQPLFGTKHTDGRSKAVGGDAVASDHRDAAATSQAKAGVRIDDMRVANAIELNVLKGVARGRDG